MTTLALYSNKGGVGKTAAAVNLAYLAAQDGFHTLLVDIDPQSSATFYFRVKPKLKSRLQGFSGGKSMGDGIKATDYENLDLLPADFSHRNLDIIFAEQKHRKQRLDMALRHFKKEYELIILDCPPTIDILAENVFNASDHLLVPLIPTTLSARTYEQLLAFMGETDKNPVNLSAFFSMVDGRKNLHRQVMASLRAQFDGILNSFIPQLSIIEQMGIYREPVPAHSPHSHAALAFRELWVEVKGRLTTDQ